MQSRSEQEARMGTESELKAVPSSKPEFSLRIKSETAIPMRSRTKIKIESRTGTENGIRISLDRAGVGIKRDRNRELKKLTSRAGPSSEPRTG
ncbi:hypothetical protein EVAR_54963_1 [Eumeta japonica]|uniref:Uncharacterized protein n=1 Tax=Eumeta variegata TaxID=151549 RepID=A0A4C1YJB3_EUMVA|nr:hypothetical protein EVAR_54963_1 [Eumeta japonica]